MRQVENKEAGEDTDRRKKGERVEEKKGEK